MSKSTISNTAKVAAIVFILGGVAVAWALSSGVLEPDISSYYPLQIGNTWTYETRQLGKMVGPTGSQESEKVGTLEQRVVRIARQSSAQLKLLEMSQKFEERETGGPDSPPVESVLYLSATPSAISLHSVEIDGADNPVMPEPVPILTDPPAKDEVTTAAGSVQMTMSVQSQEVEAVEVPAGKYPNALKKVAAGPVTGEVSGVPVSSGSVAETTWFVRDVGVVKQERVLEMVVQGPAGTELRIEERSQRELTRFSPGGGD